MTTLPPVSRFDALAHLRGCWEDLRGDGAVPARAAIDPRALGAALPDAFILERIAPGVARFRVAGQRLSRVLGTELRGLPATALFEPGARDRAAQALEAVFRGPEAAEFALRQPGGFLGRARRGRMLVLPLASDLGDISRALGCLVWDDPADGAPRRLAIEAIFATPVLCGRPLPAMTDAAGPALRVIGGGAPRAATAAPRTPARGHLRLAFSAAPA